MRLVSILLSVVLVLKFYNCTTTETLDHSDTVIPADASTLTYDVSVDTDSEATMTCSAFGRCVPTDQVYHPEGRHYPVDISRVTVTCNHRLHSNVAYGMPMEDFWVVDVNISNCVEDPLCRDFDTQSYIFQSGHPGFGYCPSSTDPQEMHLLRLFDAMELPAE